MLLLVVLAFTGYRMTHRPDAPSRDFMDLELSLPGEEGSCYSLSTTLIANRLFGATSRTWQRAGDDAWRLTVERVIQGYGGPTREYSTWTFERHGKAVELTKVDASKDMPQEPAASLDALLDAPNSIHSTPVDRCREPGAAGYRFKRK